MPLCCLLFGNKNQKTVRVYANTEKSYFDKKKRKMIDPFKLKDLPLYVTVPNDFDSKVY